jgi:hypothetical protein
VNLTKAGGVFSSCLVLFCGSEGTYRKTKQDNDGPSASGPVVRFVRSALRGLGEKSPGAKNKKIMIAPSGRKTRGFPAFCRLESCLGLFLALAIFSNY